MNKLLITDLESTCYERGKEPKDFFSEIIEIGAVLFNTSNKESESEYQEIIKPVLFPVSSFCTELTTITPDDVKKGVAIHQGLYGYKNMYDKNTTVLASWGAYDPRQIMRVCKRFKLTYPFEQKQHVNIKEAFARFYNELHHEGKPHFKSKGIGMESALRYLKIPLDGTHHRAMDDTRNIVKITQKMIEDDWNFKDDIRNPFEKQK